MTIKHYFSGLTQTHYWWG